MPFDALAAFLARALVLLGGAALLGRFAAAGLPARWRYRLGLGALLALVPLAALSFAAVSLGAAAPGPFEAVGAAEGPSAILGSAGATAGGGAAAVTAEGDVARHTVRLPRIAVPAVLARAACVAYLAGLALRAARLLAGAASAAASLGRLGACEDSLWLAAQREAAARLGLGGTVPVFQGGAAQPYVAGLLRPAIVVPSSSGPGEEWTAGRRAAAMLHETAHLLRSDCAAGFLARACASLAWCLPFSAAILSRMEQDREEACDELAVASGADPLDLAGLILDLSSPFRRPTLPCSLGIVEGPGIERRIRMLLEPSKFATSKPRRRALAAASVAALVVLGAVSLPPLLAESSPAAAPVAAEGASVEGESLELACAPRVPGAKAGSTLRLRLDALPLADPLAGVAARVTQGFGRKPNPLRGGMYFHLGVDLGDGRAGAAVLSTMDGAVVESGFEPDLGYYAKVRKGDLATLYSHLRDAPAPVGETLRIGDRIGSVGATGAATGPHLHYEVQVGDLVVDPEPLIAAGRR